MIDIHTHILPEIDDGSQSINDTFDMIDEAYKAGFTEIITTSHYMEREYAINGNRGNNNRGHIFERLCAEVMDGEQVKNKCAKCIDSGDIIVNDEHIQCKYCNATVTTEVTMRNLYKEYQERVA